MKMISILCPTFGRPHMFERLVNSLRDCADDPGTYEVWGGMDNDEPHKEDYIAITDHHVHPVICGDRVMISDKFNFMAPMTQGDILAVCDDDVVCETQGWDTLVRTEFAGKKLHLAGTNGDPNGEAFFFSRDLYEFFGYVTPPLIKHYWAIAWPKHIAWGAGISGNVPVNFVEHPDESDATHLYLLRDNHQHIANDGKAWNEGEGERNRLIELLKKARGV